MTWVQFKGIDTVAPGRALGDKGATAVAILLLRVRNPEAIAKASRVRNRSYLADLTTTMPSWLPVVQRMRPDHPWEDVARCLNHQTGQNWSVDRLRRSVRRLVSEGLADPGLIRPSPRRTPKDRLMSLIAGIANANPKLTLRDIASQLEAMHERTPRGSSTWAASSVKNLLGRAKKLRLVSP